MRTFRNQNLDGLTQSFIRRMTRECQRLDGINLGQGVCDLPTPPEILRATVEAVEADISIYSPYEGAPELRAEIARRAAGFNGMPWVDPDRHVVVTVGSSGAFHCALEALLNPGDEVIVLEPYYGYHVNSLVAGGYRPVFVTLSPPCWELDLDQLQAAVSPATRALLVNTPVNPSGKVFTREELQALGAFAREHDLLVLTDEIYEYITYGRPHTSIASLPDMVERTITISGFSKTFSMTGWRLGYAIASEQMAHLIGLVNDLYYICAPTPLQVGLARGMAQLGDRYFRDMAARYGRKRDLICETLADIGLSPWVPDGAYYVLADVSLLGFDDDKDAAMHILQTARVATVPGSAFFSGEGGKTLTRFCFATEESILREACERLREAFG